MNNKAISPSVLKIVTFSMISSHFIYAVIGLGLITAMKFDFSAAKPIVDLEQAKLMILAVLGANAFILAAIGVSMPKILMKRVAPDADDRKLLSSYTTGKIVQHAMFEAVGIFGLVMLLFSANLSVLAVSGGAILLHVLFFPYGKSVEDIRNEVSANRP